MRVEYWYFSDRSRLRIRFGGCVCEFPIESRGEVQLIVSDEDEGDGWRFRFASCGKAAILTNDVRDEGMRLLNLHGRWTILTKGGRILVRTFADREPLAPKGDKADGDIL